MSESTSSGDLTPPWRRSLRPCWSMCWPLGLTLAIILLRMCLLTSWLICGFWCRGSLLRRGIAPYWFGGREVMGLARGKERAEEQD